MTAPIPPEEFAALVGASPEQVEQWRRECEVRPFVGDLLFPEGRTLSLDEAAERSGPLHTSVHFKARRYVTTFEGFDAPWSVLDELIADLTVEPILLGAGYIASGVREA